MYQRWVLLSRSILCLFSARTSRLTLRSCICHSACSCPQSAPLLSCTLMSWLFAQHGAKIIVSHLQFHFPHAHASSGHYRGCRPPSIIILYLSLACNQACGGGSRWLAFSVANCLIITQTGYRERSSPNRRAASSIRRENNTKVHSKKRSFFCGVRQVTGAAVPWLPSSQNCERRAACSCRRLTSRRCYRLLPMCAPNLRRMQSCSQSPTQTHRLVAQQA